MGVILFVVVIFFLGVLAIAIFYFITLQNTLNAIQPKNRKMIPGQVWLGLIPLFGLVWHFIIVRKIADSISAEFTSRNLQTEKDPGYTYGLVFSILGCFTPFNKFMGMLGSLIAIVALIFWIIYWIKINEFKKQIQALPPYSDNESLIFK